MIKKLREREQAEIARQQVFLAKAILSGEINDQVFEPYKEIVNQFIEENHLGDYELNEKLIDSTRSYLAIYFSKGDKTHSAIDSLCRALVESAQNKLNEVNKEVFIRPQGLTEEQEDAIQQIFVESTKL